MGKAICKENHTSFMALLTYSGKPKSCGNYLLERVWEADLEACQLLVRGFQLKDAGYCISEGEESRADEVETIEDAYSDTEGIKDYAFPKDGMWKTVQSSDLKQKYSVLTEGLEKILHTTNGNPSDVFCHVESNIADQCRVISEKLIGLEDQLQKAIHGHDVSLAQSLQREIQMVKETLQAMLVQLQPSKEEGEGEVKNFLCDSW
nr:PREDICTED: disrupted in schizophrenia 1 protein-like [Latimeria chalumnae]|eukprot:XP_014350940.1 PREDICTED: disrupted in schizophrenia 1 protein-like [Latimeria chalumnae]